MIEIIRSTTDTEDGKRLTVSATLFGQHYEFSGVAPNPGPEEQERIFGALEAQLRANTGHLNRPMVVKYRSGK
jgi:hypothetical protein